MSARQAQPVVSRAAVVTVVTVLAALLVHVGAGSVSAWLDDHSDAVAGVVLAVAPLVSAFLARRKVTPTSSPKSDAGVPLVEAGSAAATLDAANVLAEAEAIHPAEVTS